MAELPHTLHRRGKKFRVKYKCPDCGESLESELHEAGEKDNCPACQSSFVVPGVARKASVERINEKRVREEEAKAEKRKQERTEQFEATKKAIGEIGTKVQKALTLDEESQEERRAEHERVRQRELRKERRLAQQNEVRELDRYPAFLEFVCSASMFIGIVLFVASLASTPFTGGLSLVGLPAALILFLLAGQTSLHISMDQNLKRIVKHQRILEDPHEDDSN